MPNKPQSAADADIDKPQDARAADKRPSKSDKPETATAATSKTDAGNDAGNDAGGEPDATPGELEPGDLSRFRDGRRPWMHPITHRDKRRRLGGLYWAVVYVLLVAGATSLIGFVVVRGYMMFWPSPTTTGTSVARQVVPWVFFAVFLAFTIYVTRSWVRTVVYALLFLFPYLVFLFVSGATDAAVWLVGWVPGNTQVYGLAALGPFIAFVLLGRDFVRWQLWVEFPSDSCWECGKLIESEKWAWCPTCGADLQAQRYAEAEAAQESAGSVSSDGTGHGSDRSAPDAGNNDIENVAETSSASAK